MPKPGTLKPKLDRGLCSDLPTHRTSKLEACAALRPSFRVYLKAHDLVAKVIVRVTILITTHNPK